MDKRAGIILLGLLAMFACTGNGVEGPLPPVLELLSAQVEKNTAALEARLSGASGIELAGFYLRQDGAEQVRLPAKVEDGRLFCQIKGLQYESTYYYTAFVSNGKQEVRSNEDYFVIGPVPISEQVEDPVLWTWLLDQYDADLDKNLSPDERLNVTMISFYAEGPALTSLAGLELFPNLQRLHVNNCPAITSVDFSGNPRLNILEMNNVGVRHFDLSANPELLSVSLANNQLENLNFSANPIITHLWLPENRLAVLDVSMLSRLQLLHCSDNPLKELDLRSNPMLSELKATNCPSLKYIYLHPNASLQHLEVDSHIVILK